MFSFQTLLKGTFSLLTCHLQFSITGRVSIACARLSDSIRSADVLKRAKRK